MKAETVVQAISVHPIIDFDLLFGLVVYIGLWIWVIFKLRHPS